MNVTCGIWSHGKNIDVNSSKHMHEKNFRVDLDFEQHIKKSCPSQILPNKI